MIRASHFFTVQYKILDVKTGAIQIKDKLDKKFMILNDQTLNKQTSVIVPTVDSNKNRELLMQMLAANSQVTIASDPFVATIKNDDRNDNKRELAMSELASPVNLTAIEENSQIVLFWNSVNMALGYNVKRATVSGGPYTIIANQILKNNYTDTTVKNGITYYYVVTSLNEYAESINSNEVFAAVKKNSC
jgi:Fibronectin type 3 domain-containing protein